MLNTVPLDRCVATDINRVSGSILQVVIINFIKLISTAEFLKEEDQKVVHCASWTRYSASTKAGSNTKPWRLQKVSARKTFK